MVWFLLFFLSGLFLYLLLKRNSLSRQKGYWKTRGYPEIDVSSSVTELDILLGRKDITERDDLIYQIMNRDGLKYAGVIENPEPVILLKDLELVKRVMIKDFDHFVDRRPFFGAARDGSVLRKMLGNLTGDEWKGVRSSVSPTFTTGKIRGMMDSFNRVGLEWAAYLKERCTGKEPLKIKVFHEVLKYTGDVVASAMFGLQADTVQNPNSLFGLMGSRLIDISTFQNMKFTLSLRFPRLFRFFNLDIFMDMQALGFFEAILKRNLRRRMTGQDEKRNDFLQLLVEARNSEKKLGKPELLSEHMMNSQCLSFFFAGFRTTSHFITNAMYALALHPEVQSRLREEVEGIVKDDDGSVDYDQLMTLTYLDMVVSEILRMLPANLRLERTCIAEYEDTETGLRVEKGTIVGIPLHSIHHDPEFYDTPHNFNPEHFRADKKAARSPYAFMPFGAGPRSCIGMRFAVVESKCALAHLVHNFIIQPTSRTPTPLLGKRVNFQITPPPDLELELVPITK